MAEKQLRFALFGKKFQDDKADLARKILACMEQSGAALYIDRSFYDHLTARMGLKLTPAGVFDGRYFEADFAVSIGGDGTFLKAASRVGNKQIPILGINMGRLGFLAEVLPEETKKALDGLKSGGYSIEKRSVILAEASNGQIKGSPFALNEVAVLKQDNASMISIKASIDGNYLATYRADGLIVTTPTGSTAYNLSNGGPVMVPNSGNFCLTAVAPHSLTVRPIVINDDSIVTLDVESRSHNYLIAIDGRSERLPEHARIRLQKAPYTVGVVTLKDRPYFSTLHQKMMWGADSRM